MVDSTKSDFDPAKNHLLEQAVAEYLSAVESGELPDRNEFLLRYSEIADELREFLEQRHRLDELVKPIRNLNKSWGADPAAGETIRYFGDYELVDEIARGGMGIVFKARQVSLNRLVALKMILDANVASDQDRERFRAEAESVARLDHENIVPIYEVGEHEGRQYFSMKLIPGGNLRDRIAESGALEGGAAARLMVKLSQAVHFAHQHGILHRDLKPGNILLGSRAVEEIPLITDFGLAKNEERNDELTQSGMVIGTPHYMSPEQADGKSKSLTTTTDVYGLGAILFFCLTGKPPFHEASPAEILQFVKSQPPTSPSRIVTGIDRDLDTICLKCLNKDPKRRYRSAEELADDLQRHLNGEPIHARPISMPERCIKWIKRNQAIAALIGVCAFATLALIAGLITSNIFIREEQRRTAAAYSQVQIEQTKTKQALGQLEIEQRSTKNALWDAYLSQAESLLRSGRAGMRFQSMEAISNANRIQNEPGFELSNDQLVRIRSAAIAAHSVPLDLQLLHSTPIEQFSESIYYSPDLQLFGIAWSNKPISIRNAKSNKELFALENTASLPIGIQFTPDNRLIVITRNGQATVFEVNEDRSTAREVFHIRTWLFQTDHQGNRFAYIEESGDIAVFDRRTGKQHLSLKFEFEPTYLQFSQDGRQLAASDTQGSLRLYDVETGTELANVQTPSTGRCFDICWSSDHRQCVVSFGQTVHVVDTLAQELLLTVDTGVTSNRIALIDNKSIMITSGWDQLVRFWDLRHGGQILKLDGRLAGNSTDGRIAVADTTHIKTWQIQTSEIVWSNVSLPSPPTDRSGAFHPELPMIATARDSGVQLWHAKTGRRLAEIPLGTTKSVAFHPQSGDLITSGTMGLAKWPVQQDQNNDLNIGPPEFFELPGRFIPESVNFSNDGGRLGVDSQRFAAAMTLSWDSPAKPHRLSGDAGLNSIAVTRNGRYAATGNYRGNKVSVWDAGTGQNIKSISFGGSAWVKQGVGANQFVARSEDKSYVYDAKTLKLNSTLDFLVEEYSRDGMLGSVFLHGHEVGLIDGRNHKLLAVLTNHFSEKAGWDLSFNPDASMLLQVQPKKGMLVWNLQRIHEILKSVKLDWDSNSTQFRSVKDVNAVNIRYTNEKLEIQAPQPIDLEPYFNWSYLEIQELRVTGENSASRSIDLLPRNQILALNGIPFKVGSGFMQLGVKYLNKIDHEVNEISVDRTATKLHFLHNTRWGLSVPAGSEIGHYVVRYDDDSKETISLVTGKNIVEWMEVNLFQHLTEAQPAWLSPTEKGGWIGLSVLSWDNPHPEKTIATIDFVSAQNGSAAPFCLAISSSQ